MLAHRVHIAKVLLEPMLIANAGGPIAAFGRFRSESANAAFSRSTGSRRLSTSMCPLVTVVVMVFPPLDKMPTKKETLARIRGHVPPAQALVRRRLGTASRLAFPCPQDVWKRCTIMRPRPRFRFLTGQQGTRLLCKASPTPVFSTS